MGKAQGVVPVMSSALEADMRSRYTPQQFDEWVAFLAKQERLARRDHRKMLKLGIVWPYKSVYQGLEENMEKRQLKQNDDLVLLGLDPNVDFCKREVKNAYRRQSRKLHPDVGGTDEAFKTLHTAYRKVLANTKA